MTAVSEHSPAQATTSWRPWLLVLLQSVALLWLASWYFEQSPIRPLWDKVDAQVFLTLNGSLQEGRAWQVFWALANNRAFDMVSAILMGGLYLTYVFADGQRDVARRIGQFFFLLLFTVLVIQLSKLGLRGIQRPSPTNNTEWQIYRLSELVPSLKPKDSSGRSFPGDHATVLFMWTGFLFLFASWRQGLAALIVALLFSTPRLVAGAHWFTDNLVGGVAIALSGIAWISATPLRIKSLTWFQRLGHWLEPALRKILRGLRLIKREADDAATAESR